VPRISIAGIEIDYELLGKPGAPAVALTPGGRFPRDTPGLPELAANLAAGGKRVLLWNRPNCGASDISFSGDNESEMHARVLTRLIRALELGPTVIAGGSGGARVSLIAASRDPDIVSHLAIWWISGGAVGLISLGWYYCCGSALAASQGGMEAVANLPEWALQIQRNPRNRDIILSQDRDEFIRTMDRWAAFYVPSAISPVPGMSPEDFAQLRMPTLVFRSGKSDLSHPRKTSDWVRTMIPHCDYRDPPWADDEWNYRSIKMAREGSGLFVSWPKLAPAILEFTSR
jgi:2-hydroxy-6-oxonona-2,4-dienedioate hydrolase